jgi:hypothetical protein
MHPLVQLVTVVVLAEEEMKPLGDASSFAMTMRGRSE